jgi:hypothetical protein
MPLGDTTRVACVTVKAADGSVLPTGYQVVLFYDDAHGNSRAWTQVLDGVADMARFPLDSLAAGTWTLQGRFPEHDKYAGSRSVGATLVVSMPTPPPPLAGPTATISDTIQPGTYTLTRK